MLLGQRLKQNPSSPGFRWVDEKKGRRHQKGVIFVEGFFPKGTTLDGFFFIKLKKHPHSQS